MRHWNKSHACVQRRVVKWCIKFRHHLHLMFNLQTTLSISEYESSDLGAKLNTWKVQFREYCIFITKGNWLMLFREIIGCLFSEWHEVHKCILWAKCWIFFLLKLVVYIITSCLKNSNGKQKFIVKLQYGYPLLLTSKLNIFIFISQSCSMSQASKWSDNRDVLQFSVFQVTLQTEAENNV